MSEKQEDFKIVESNKKSKYRKPKKLPVNYDDIDKWKMPEINSQIVKGPFLEESSFATLFPKYREKYIKEVFSLVQKALRQNGIKAELDLLEGSMTVRTTKKTFDPYAIIKARDIIKLLARSVPYEVCLKLLQEDTYCDVIKIKSLVRNKEKFIKRRKRLIGPNGDTIKALEILTECYILVQGHTVSIIGHYKKMKQTRRIIEGIMTNTHPVFYIKDLMIKRELMKDEKLQNQSWDRFLPKFQNNNTNQIPKKKKIKKKDKQEKTQFPNAPQPRKIDLQMESGEYFLSEEQKKKHQEKLRQEKRQIKKKERIQQRIERYEESKQTQPKLKQIDQQNTNKQKIDDKEISNLVNKFKIDVKNSLIQQFQQYIQKIVIMKIFLCIFFIYCVESSILQHTSKPERDLSGDPEDPDPKKPDPNNPDPNNPDPNNPDPNNPDPNNPDPNNPDPNNPDPNTEKKEGEGDETDETEKEKKPKDRKFKSTFEVNPENIQKVVFKEIASILLKDSPKDDDTAMNFANKFIFFTQDGNSWMNFQDFKSQGIQSTNYRFALKENLNSPVIFEIYIDMSPQKKTPPRPNPEDIPVNNNSDDQDQQQQQQEEQSAPVEKEQIVVILKNEYFYKKITSTKDVFGIPQFYPYFEQQIKEAVMYQEQIIYSLDDIKDDLLTMLVDTFSLDSFTIPSDSFINTSKITNALSGFFKKAIGSNDQVDDGFNLIENLKSKSKSKKIGFSQTQQKQKPYALDINAIQQNKIEMNVNLIDYQSDSQNALQFVKQLLQMKSQKLYKYLPDDSEFLQKSIMYYLESTNSAIDNIWIIIFMSNEKIHIFIDSDNYTYEKSLNFQTKLNLMQLVQSQVVYLREIFLRNLALLQYGVYNLEENVQDFDFLFNKIPQQEFQATKQILHDSQDFQIEINILDNLVFRKIYPMYSQFQSSLLAIDYFKILNNFLQMIGADHQYIAHNHFNNNQIVEFFPLLQPEKKPAFFDNVGKLNFEPNNDAKNSYFDLTLIKINRPVSDQTQISRNKVHYPEQKRIYYSWKKGKKTMNENLYLYKVFNGGRRKKII